MRLGTHSMHTGTFHLLDNKGRQLAIHRRFRGTVNTIKHSSGKFHALRLRKISAVDISTLLIRVIKIFRVDQHHFIKTVTGP